MVSSVFDLEDVLEGVPAELQCFWCPVSALIVEYKLASEFLLVVCFIVEYPGIYHFFGSCLTLNLKFRV